MPQFLFLSLFSPLDLLLSPFKNLGVHQRPSTPKVLWTRECAPTPFLFVVFTFGLEVESIQEFGGASLMCFVWTCWVGLFVNDIASWLSHRITIALFFFMYFDSFMSFVIDMVSLFTCVFTTYSPLVIDKVIVGCLLLLQEMAPPPIMNIDHVVDLLSSRSLAQSASQYPTKF